MPKQLVGTWTFHLATGPHGHYKEGEMITSDEEAIEAKVLYDSTLAQPHRNDTFFNGLNVWRVAGGQLLCRRPEST